MTTADLRQRVWTAARDGNCVLVLGAAAGVPSPPDGWWQITVRCDGPPRMLGPVIDAQGQVDRLVGSRTSVVELAADRFRNGLRRRLLGENGDDAVSGDGDIVGSLNRLTDIVDGPSAIVFDVVDAADAATIAFLTRVIARPGWLRPTLVLGLGTRPDGGPVADLLAAARAHGTIVQEPAPSKRRAARALGGGPFGPAPRHLSSDTRQVLRAAAVIGDGFELALLARLLGTDPMTVLLRLQDAWDAGVAIEDLGEGRFHIDAELAARLRKELLPSLALAWHRSLAEHLAGSRAGTTADLPASSTAENETEPAPSGENQAATISDAPTRARAAHHSAQAGDVDLAIARYLDAARDLADQGAGDQALVYANEALVLLGQLPRTPQRKRRAALALAITGRLRWQTGSGDGDGFTLEAAYQSLSEALQLLDDSDDRDDIALRAEIHRLRAAVSYDFGDDEHLDQALAELTEATRELSRAKQPRAAARLLNDQAAVLVAMGDPVRAASLLEQSLQTFQVLSARAARNARREGRPLTAEEIADQREVAETRHLMARLPLQVDAKPGMQRRALDKAMEHASEAEDIYQRLGHLRDAARVWQTHGQLARIAGELATARERLSRAAQAQQNLGDAIGLAQTTQAMACLLGDRHEHAEALRLLVSSIRLNQGKGSPRGLAWNRRTLGDLAQGMSESEREDRAPMLVAVRRQLEAAEAQLGRVDLPGGGRNA